MQEAGALITPNNRQRQEPIGLEPSGQMTWKIQKKLFNWPYIHFICILNHKQCSNLIFETLLNLVRPGTKVNVGRASPLEQRQACTRRCALVLVKENLIGQSLPAT